MSRRGLIVATLIASLLVASCGQSTAPSTADLNFVASMVPHHHLGMDLLDDAAPRVQDVRLRRLVFEMSGYHHAEMAILERHLEEWRLGEAVAFEGDLNDADLSRLHTASGGDYDVLWLRLMIAHHRGALVLARSQIEGGSVDELLVMATSVRDLQQDQIDEMQKLLSELCGTAAVAACDEELDAD